jgi:hypothetical protein
MVEGADEEAGMAAAPAVPGGSPAARLRRPAPTIAAAPPNLLILMSFLPASGSRLCRCGRTVVEFSC